MDKKSTTIKTTFDVFCLTMITAWLFSENWDGKGWEWSAYPRSKTRGALLRTLQPTGGSRKCAHAQNCFVLSLLQGGSPWATRQKRERLGFASPTLSYV
jgi:hypothetical protein